MTYHTFKLNDAVKILHDFNDTQLIGLTGKITRCHATNEHLYDVEFTHKIEQRQNIVNQTTHIFLSTELELVKKRED